MTNFRAQIDINAITAGTPEVKALRTELERLLKAVGTLKPIQVQLNATATLNQLARLNPAISSLQSRLAGLKGTMQGPIGAGFITQAQISTINQATAAIQRYSAAAQHAGSATAAARAGSTAMAGGMGGLGLAAAGAAGYGATKSLVSSGIDNQAVKSSLMAANNMDAEKTAADYAYLTQQALKWGTSLREVGTEFSRIKIAAELAGKSQGFSAEHAAQVSRGLLESLLQVRTSLHLTSEQTGLMGKAFTDMLSKGKVSSEELKKQLGNYLPGSVALAAEALGITTDKLMQRLKEGAINSYQFVALMSEQMTKKYGASAEAASQQLQTSLGRLGVQYNLLKADIGEGGLFDAMAKSANDLSKYLATPEVAESAKRLGAGLGEMVTWLDSASKKAATFYRENKTVIDTVAKLGGYLVATNLAMKAFGFAVLGPLGAMQKMGTVLIDGAGAVARLTGLLPGLGAAWGGIATSLVAPIAAMASVVTLMKQIDDGKGFENLNAKINSFDPNLMKDKAALQKRIELLQEKIGSYESSTLAKTARGENGTFAKEAVQFTGKLANNLGANVDFTAADAKQAEDKRTLIQLQLQLNNLEETGRKAKAKEDAAKPATPTVKVDRNEMLAGVFGAGKDEKGKVEAEKALASANRARNRAQWQAEKADLDYQLEQNLVSYEKYAAERMRIKKEQWDDDAAEVGREVAGIKDAGIREATRQAKLQTLALQYAEEDKQVSRQLDERKTRMLDAERELQGQLQSETSTALDARYAEIDAKYAKQLREFVQNGQQAGIDAINGLIAVERAQSRMEALDKVLNRVSTAGSIKQSEVQLQASSGQLTEYEAADKLLTIRKEQAAAELALTQAAFARGQQEGMTAEEQLRYLQKMVEYKTILAEKGREQQRVEQAVMDGFSAALDQFDGSIKSIESGFKALFSSLLKSFNKMLADMATQKLKQALFSDSGASGGGGSSGLGGLLGGLLTSAADWAFGSSSGSAGTASASLPSAAASYNSAGLAGVGGQSIVPSQSVSNVVMNITTPDSNSFRNTVRQSNSDLRLALAR